MRHGTRRRSVPLRCGHTIAAGGGEFCFWGLRARRFEADSPSRATIKQSRRSAALKTLRPGEGLDNPCRQHAHAVTALSDCHLFKIVPTKAVEREAACAAAQQPARDSPALERGPVLLAKAGRTQDIHDCRAPWSLSLLTQPDRYWLSAAVQSSCLRPPAQQPENNMMSDTIKKIIPYGPAAHAAAPSFL